MDIEGSEAVWLEHPPRLPSSVKTLVVEIHPTIVGVRAAAGSIQAIIDEGFAVSGISNTVFALSRA